MATKTMPAVTRSAPDGLRGLQRFVENQKRCGKLDAQDDQAPAQRERDVEGKRAQKARVSKNAAEPNEVAGGLQEDEGPQRVRLRGELENDVGPCHEDQVAQQEERIPHGLRHGGASIANNAHGGKDFAAAALPLAAAACRAPCRALSPLVASTRLCYY